MRRLSATLLAGALLLTAACGGGDDTTESGPDTGAGATRPLFQPAGVVGPDSFSPSFAAATYQATAARPATTTAPTVEPGSTVSGSTPGLYAGRTYGGSGANICDVEKMIAFLTFYEERGRAWAAVQGIDVEDLDTYLRDLTPVFALYDLNVTMFGFRDGRSYGYDAVLEAGTAILIDDQGMPRARCACGNPLLGPTEDIPAGTDEPTPDDPDGNPQTQDSVPPETGDVPGETPGDQPNPSREPVCPDGNSPNPRYIDPDGTSWYLNPFTGQWISLDDPDQGDVPTDQLPGYLDQCGDPGGRRAPACPYWNPSTQQWAVPAEFVDADGQLWRGPADSDEWTRVDTDERRLLTAIPGYVENCLDPTDSEPTCPSPVSDGWTPYQNAFGETFDYVLLVGWVSTATGERFENVDDIPGYVEDCGAPDTANPCPPLRPRLGEIWVDPDGGVWTAEGTAGRNGPGPTTAWAGRWRNADTGVTNSVRGLYIEFCGDLRLDERPEPLCPPANPALGEMWIDTEGSTWVYGAGKGGTLGWDDLSTETVEVFRTGELPNTPDGCDPIDTVPSDTVTNRPCPPILNIPEGYAFNGSNGSTYVWTPSTGGWVGDSGDVIVYTVLLPGFRQLCLPPCPPADATLHEAPGIWVDPSTGDIWIKVRGGVTWIQPRSGVELKDTRDLPFWREECLPPCAPGTNGEPTFARDEDGRPVSDAESSGPITIDLSSGVTVTPSPEGSMVTEIFPEFLRPLTAVGDDCNPKGCVDLTQVPALGHYFLDSYGVAWRYSDGDLWQSETGESVYSVFDIPGYGTACLPDEATPTRDCPQEFEGTRYTDSRNITWIWVGTNATAEESTHEKKWFTRHDDGTVEYRYTFQLDPFLADCPKPADLDEALDVIVSVRPPRELCAGDDVNFTFTVIEVVDGATVDYELAVDGETIARGTFGDGIFVVPWSPTSPGEHVVTIVVTTSDGHRSEDSLLLDVLDCGESNIVNEAPIIELGLSPTCVEAPAVGAADLAVFVVIADADGDTVNVRVSGGSPDLLVAERTGSVEGDGELAFSYPITADYSGQIITFDVEADDGIDRTNATATVRVESTGGCSATTTATTNAPATVTTTRPPTTTTTTVTTTTRPPTTTTTTTTRPPTTTTTTTTVARPNNTPDVSYDLTSAYDANNQLCTVRVSAVDVDPGQTVSIGTSGDAVSSTFGEVIRTYTIRVGPNTRASIQDQYPGHAVFDSGGARIPLSFTVEARLGGNGYSCVRV